METSYKVEIKLTDKEEGQRMNAKIESMVQKAWVG